MCEPSCSFTNCSVVSSKSFFGLVISNSGIIHSPGGSCVKTDEKNFDKTSTFSISLVVKGPSSCTKAGIAFCHTIFSHSLRFFVVLFLHL